jgi:hypothetical protein
MFKAFRELWTLIKIERSERKSRRRVDFLEATADLSSEENPEFVHEPRHRMRGEPFQFSLGTTLIVGPLLGIVFGLVGRAYLEGKPDLVREIEWAARSLAQGFLPVALVFVIVAFLVIAGLRFFAGSVRMAGTSDEHRGFGIGLGIVLIGFVCVVLVTLVVFMVGGHPGENASLDELEAFRAREAVGGMLCMLLGAVFAVVALFMAIGLTVR